MNLTALLGPLFNIIIKWMNKKKAIRDLLFPLFAKAAADGALPDNKARREWAAAVLMTEYGMSETDAFALVQNGFKSYQWVQRKIAKKAAKKAASTAAKRG